MMEVINFVPIRYKVGDTVVYPSYFSPSATGLHFIHVARVSGIKIEVTGENSTHVIYTVLTAEHPDDPDTGVLTDYIPEENLYPDIETMKREFWNNLPILGQ